MTCTRCKGTGFLNTHQLPKEAPINPYDLVNWLENWKEEHDVTLCDCCSDGTAWYGEPGEHYTDDDPPGPGGPYADTGGFCECHGFG